MDETLGQKIKRLREAKGLSQSALARLLDVKPQAVQKWEGTGVPRTQRLDGIAAALGVTSAYLMGSETQRVAADMVAGWPFGVSKKRYDDLTALQRARIEGVLEGMIIAMEAEDQSPKRKRAS